MELFALLLSVAGEVGAEGVFPSPMGEGVWERGHAPLQKIF